MKIQTTDLTVKEAIENSGSAYIIGWKTQDPDDYITEELQASDYWVGGEEGGWTSDSNVAFDSPEHFERYISRVYQVYAVFEYESDRDVFIEGEEME